MRQFVLRLFLRRRLVRRGHGHDGLRRQPCSATLEVSSGFLVGRDTFSSFTLHAK